MVSDVSIKESEVADRQVIGSGDGGQVVGFLDLVRQDDVVGA